MRLIDADKFAEDICNFSAIDEHSANAVIFLLHEQPTVDIKTEVARQIFEEIEGKLRHTKVAYREEVFNELKNKYTKEGV